MYPPDSSGRRPSQHTQLQYVSPTQREAYERSEATRVVQPARDYYPNQPTGNYGPPPYNQSTSLRTTGTSTPTARRAEPTVTRGAGDYTSSESSSSGGGQRPHTQPTLTKYWYCCMAGCPNNGPYIEGLYENCYNGCGHTKCLGCRREIYSLRDRPPADYQSSKPWRRS